MTFKDNPNYEIAFESKELVLYMPVDKSQYHKSRELAMIAQEKYSNAGISKEVLQAFANDLIDRCNKSMSRDTLRTDVAVIANNLLARTQNPIDELCAIRMGAIACFLEGEEPDTVSHAWTEKKMRLADQYPDVYAFFLDTGVAFTPQYAALLRTLTAEDYLTQRAQTLKGLTLPPIRSEQ